MALLVVVGSRSIFHLVSWEGPDPLRAFLERHRARAGVRHVAGRLFVSQLRPPLAGGVSSALRALEVTTWEAIFFKLLGRGRGGAAGGGFRRITPPPQGPDELRAARARAAAQLRRLGGEGRSNP